MVEPLKPFQIDEEGNIRCGRGILKGGKRKGEKCRGIILARDRTVACHNCGEKYTLSELLEEVERLGYLARQTPNQKEKRRGKMQGEKNKTLSALKRIIRKAMKDEENIVELTMIGKNSFDSGTHTFTKERFVGIKNDIVIFNDLPSGSTSEYVPLVKIESIKVRKKMPGGLNLAK